MSDRSEIWTVTYGEGRIMPGPPKPATWWERNTRWFRWPFWRAWYATGDALFEASWRVKGAWLVLVGKARWYD